MNLSALDYMVAVAETGGFTRAADRLGIAQPTLSVAIRRLEEEFGQPLFDRAGRRARLTPFGQQFLVRARAILAEYRAARAEARQPAASATRLRLGLLATLAGADVARLLASFGPAQPDVALEISEGTSAELERRLGRGQLDAAINTLPKGASGESALPLYREPYRLALALDHRLAARDRVAIADLKDLPFVVRPNCEVLAEADRAFANAGVKPRVAARTAHEARLLEFVRAGTGGAFLPESVGRAPGIVLVEIQDLPLGRRIGLVWRPGAATLVRPLARFLGAHGWGDGGASSLIGH